MRAALIVVAMMFGIAGADVAKARQPNALVLVIDRSGSMQGPKLEAVKQAAIAAISTLQPDDQVAVVAYDSDATIFVKPQAASNRVRIGKDIDRITAGGGTNIFPGLQEAHEILEGLTAKTKHVILLSDGEAPYDGISDLVKEMRTHNITVSTVAVAGADEKLLKDISDDGGGRLYKVTDLKQLSLTYVKETKLALARP